MSGARVEFTVLDDKLFSEKLATAPDSGLVYATPYRDAVEAPFPAEGKRGLAVYVGGLKSFSEPKARLIWELEKRRGRPTVLVLASLRGRNYLRSVRELETELADPRLVPACFLRRRGNVWDSVDSFSPGESDSMKGAHLRVKRMKQAAWEHLVDRLTTVDESIKDQYFRDLYVDRESLLEAASRAIADLRCSPVVGMAGECLNRKNLFSLLEQPIVARLTSQVAQPALPLDTWVYLGKRDSARELILCCTGNSLPHPGVIFRAGDEAEPSEFAVGEVIQSLKFKGSGLACRLKVTWRYPPGREIPTLWRQKTALTAGADDAGG